MNINPLYLQEVSREYYTKILNNSPQQKAAARLTKRWLAKNPKASREDILDKFGDFSYKVHDRYDKARKRQWDNTFVRNGLIHQMKNINKDDPINKFKENYGWTKNDAFGMFRNDTKAMREPRLKELENSRKNKDKSKIVDAIFNL